MISFAATVAVILIGQNINDVLKWWHQSRKKEDLIVIHLEEKRKKKMGKILQN